ncbi:LacI family DNA-binding transcriptional regulator [Saxibacter everestensis]|uniref:LacI family DNA-binding transcriptional regulator n=1 Tax=Saxibacter everestensis TaxID=2909229 RepID=A0ABY8QV57_9MICO|nr:LacI family DNA-binding transcriptional regulator [Brevibacteriaceae bacterium ZFBP1038]
MNIADGRKRAASILDVARLAGVSHQTVSRVINDQQNIRPSTREKVERAIQQLNYRPNSAARALVTKKTRTIGVYNSGGAFFGPASTLVGFTDAARAAGYQVNVINRTLHTVEPVQNVIDSLQGHNVDGIVAIAAEFDSIGALQGVRLNVPLVAAESSGQRGVPSVSIDQCSGARMATEHLIELGHRRILHVAGPAHSSDGTERIRGWHQTMSAHDLPAAEPILGDWSPASGYAAGQEIARRLKADPRCCTAIVSGNDQMALGIIKAFNAAGISVPRDVSIVGFDDIPEAEFFLPPLTTVRQQFDRLGQEIMGTMLKVLAGQHLDEPVIISPEFVIRSSTAPAAQS